MDKFLIRKTQIVELIVAGVAGGNTQTQIQFTPQTYLQGKKISSLETFSSNDVPTSPLGNTVATIGQLKGAFLTLYFQDPDNPGSGGQFIQFRPLVTFHRVQNGTDAYVRDFPVMDGMVITWEKSFINLTTALANTTNISFLFDVGYYD